MQSLGDVIDEPVLRALFAALGRGVPGDLSLVRVGANVVVKSDAEARLWRISRGIARRQVERDLRVVAGLPNAPVVAPDALEVATAEPDYAMTRWRLGRPLSAVGAYTALGGCLAGLSRIAPPPALRRFDDFRLVARRLKLARERGAPEQYLRLLRARAAEVIPAMRHAIRAGNALLHGDAHVGNLVLLDGKARLIDLDGLCVGPWQLDIVPTKVAYDRLGLPAAGWAYSARSAAPPRRAAPLSVSSPPSRRSVRSSRSAATASGGPFAVNVGRAAGTDQLPRSYGRSCCSCARGSSAARRKAPLRVLALRVPGGGGGAADALRRSRILRIVLTNSFSSNPVCAASLERARPETGTWAVKTLGAADGEECA